MKKTTIISCIIFLLLLAAGGYYVIQPEITPRKILSSVRSLFETKKETRSREIREAMECKPDKPLSRGERYALAMKEYWQRRVNAHWWGDEWLENNMDDPPPKGIYTIVVNKNMCGLERDWLGHPKFMWTDSCYPFRLDGYPTLEALESLLKKQPDFVPEEANAEFAEVARKNLGGKKYDPAGEGFLQQPEHYHRPSRFGVLKTSNWFVKFYAEDCCTLNFYQEFVAYLKQKYPMKWQSWAKTIPIEVRENSDYLTIDYVYVKSKIDSNADDGGYNEMYLVNPCGELVNF